MGETLQSVGFVNFPGRPASSPFFLHALFIIHIIGLGTNNFICSDAIILLSWTF